MLRTGACARVWARQGDSNVVATLAQPSTPFDLTQTPFAGFITIARPAPAQNTNSRPGSDYLSFITDADTVSVAITCISREA